MSGRVCRTTYRSSCCAVHSTSSPVSTTTAHPAPVARWTRCRSSDSSRRLAHLSSVASITTPSRPLRSVRWSRQTSTPRGNIAGRARDPGLPAVWASAASTAKVRPVPVEPA
ncbi:hypothetical protein [Thermocatellispora tengchongensis]|uniref:hypothetical protein n=1 Tax=Thermocatellispora tengchongensis TaxID=1073253 RepID=UPI00363C2049